MASNVRKLRSAEIEGAVAALPDGRRATSYDVARLAGVSQSAVSRCFKPGASVSKQMRERVMAAAEALEYQPNAIARGLITRRSNLVAVFISGRVSLYYPEVLFRLTEQLAARGLRVLLFTIESEADSAAMLDQVWRYQADGVISASHLSLEQYQQLERRGVPVVFFNRYFASYSTNAVYCDPTRQVHAMAARLMTLGHRRLGLIRGPELNMVARERMRIVAETLMQSGLAPIGEAAGDFTYESGAAALQDIWANAAQPPTAVICANDMMALGCVDEARQVLGLEVPQDLSIVGFDGINLAQFSSYELTTIRQPIERMAEAAVGILQGRIETPEQSNEKRVFEGVFLEGATIAAARP